MSHGYPGVGRGDEQLGVGLALPPGKLSGHVQGVQGSAQLLLSAEIQMF